MAKGRAARRQIVTRAVALALALLMLGAVVVSAILGDLF